MDRLTALRHFRVAAESASFAEASRRLGVSPGAVSKNVSELEAHLDARLFNRNTRRISLTEAGTVYLDRIRHLLDGLEEADRAIAALSGAPTGVLRVAAPVSLSLACFSRVIPRFLAAHPQISIHLDLDDRKVDIVAGGYDVALRGSDRLDDSSLMARKLMDMPHVICAAPAYLSTRGLPAKPEDLRQHECLRYALAGHPGEWILSQGGEPVRVGVSGRFTATSSLAVRDAAVEGLGICLVPTAFVAPELADGRLVRVLRDWEAPVASVYAVYPSRHHLAPKLKAFIDAIMDDARGRGSRTPTDAG